MSVIEDVRKVIQDLVAPDLQAIKVRLENVEKQIAEMKSDQKEFERRAEKRHEELMDKIRVTVDYAVVLERLARVEKELQQKRLQQ